MRAAAVQGNVGIGVAKILADVLGGFAHDLDELGSVPTGGVVAVEVTALPIGTVGDHLGRGLGEVPKSDAVLRPHRGDGRWPQPGPGNSG
jgi:hypothetical protein